MSWCLQPQSKSSSCWIYTDTEILRILRTFSLIILININYQLFRDQSGSLKHVFQPGLSQPGSNLPRRENEEIIIQTWSEWETQRLWTQVNRRKKSEIPRHLPTCTVLLIMMRVGNGWTLIILLYYPKLLLLILLVICVVSIMFSFRLTALVTYSLKSTFHQILSVSTT